MNQYWQIVSFQFQLLYTQLFAQSSEYQTQNSRNAKYARKHLRTATQVQECTETIYNYVDKYGSFVQILCTFNLNPF